MGNDDFIVLPIKSFKVIEGVPRPVSWHLTVTVYKTEYFSWVFNQIIIHLSAVSWQNPTSMSFKVMSLLLLAIMLLSLAPQNETFTPGAGMRNTKRQKMSDISDYEKVIHVSTNLYVREFWAITSYWTFWPHTDKSTADYGMPSGVSQKLLDTRSGHFWTSTLSLNGSPYQTNCFDLLWQFCLATTSKKHREGIWVLHV